MFKQPDPLCKAASVTANAVCWVSGDFHDPVGDLIESCTSDAVFEDDLTTVMCFVTESGEPFSKVFRSIGNLLHLGDVVVVWHFNGSVRS